MNFRVLRAVPYAGAAALAILLFAIAQIAEEPAAAQDPVEFDVAAFTPDAVSVKGVAAMQINASRSPSSVQVQAAKPFIIDALGSGLRDTRALTCLTEAIYYEAGSENKSGQEAVAQVVLNRVRHSAYPNTVCGVVYQGSERSTGCQFTFTCDGSLTRVPSPAAWQRAKAVAASALAGRVQAVVGYATHYHADYVVPYWSSSLDRIAKIGSHIFYQIEGASGKASAFTQSYAGNEPPTPLKGSRLALAAAHPGLTDVPAGPSSLEPNIPGTPQILAEQDAEKLDDFGLLEFRGEWAGGDGMETKVAVLDVQLNRARENKTP